MLDIFITNGTKYPLTVKTLNELSSDHLPILTEVNIIYDKKQTTLSWTNWTQFERTLKISNSQINSPDDLNRATSTLEQEIQETINNCTYTKNVSSKFTLPHDIKNLFKEKNKARRKYHQTLDPRDKNHLNNITNSLKRAIRNHNNKKWDNALQNLDEDVNALWKLTKTFKTPHHNVPPILHNGTLISTPKEKLEVFADAFQNQFMTNNPNLESQKIEIEVDDFIKDIPYLNSDNEIPQTNTNEVTKIIKTLKNKKTLGHNKITNATIKHLNDEAIARIVEILNAILKYHTFPNRWKHSNIILIHKAGKPTKEVTSYRPISLLPSLSKIAEKIILARFNEYADKIIPNEQHGFRKQHSTIHQLHRLVSFIKENTHKNRSVTAIFLDMEKAFDKV